MDTCAVLSILSFMALIGGLLGQWKGKPIRGAVVGFFLGPFGWLLIAISPDNRPLCPYCRGAIADKARKCRNCGSRIPRCPGCRKQLGPVRRDECRRCRTELTGEEWDD